MSIAEISQNARVYGSDGVEIGVVTELWMDTPLYGCLPLLGSMRSVQRRRRAGDGLGSLEDGYLQIRYGEFSGAGHHDFFVPLYLLRRVTRDEIVLCVTAQDCERHFVADLTVA